MTRKGCPRVFIVFFFKIGLGITWSLVFSAVAAVFLSETVVSGKFVTVNIIIFLVSFTELQYCIHI